MNIKKGKSGRRYQYDLPLRRKVCEELLSGKITIGEIGRKYNIPGAATIMRWLKRFQEEQAELLSSQPMENSQVSTTDNSNEKSTKEIEAELRLAKAKIATLETMIDIAEDQFKIEIRKKSGTKPSSE